MMDMILTWVCYFFMAFAGIRLIISLVNLLTPMRLISKRHLPGSLVSVLIPARNEETNLPDLLDRLLEQEYPNIEIIVYNDQSTDRTGSILEAYTRENPSIRYLDGIELPKDWLGKNHACYQLAKNAIGDYFLFLDADTKPRKNLVGDSLAYMQAHQLKLLSIFPRQSMESPGEKLVVPLMNWLLLSMLPMFLIRFSSWKSFSAANGQFMLFDARNYKENQWHEQVKDNPVEDIAIMRRMKAREYKVMTLISDGSISCRMYQSFSQALSGFSKNFSKMLGNIWVLVLFTLLIITGPILCLFYLDMIWWLVFPGMIIINRVFISLKSKQAAMVNLALHIPQIFSFVLLVIKSIKVALTGRLDWKGRNIEV